MSDMSMVKIVNAPCQTICDAEEEEETLKPNANRIKGKNAGMRYREIESLKDAGRIHA